VRTWNVTERKDVDSLLGSIITCADANDTLTSKVGLHNVHILISTELLIVSLHLTRANPRRHLGCLWFTPLSLLDCNLFCTAPMFIKHVSVTLIFSLIRIPRRR